MYSRRTGRLVQFVFPVRESCSGIRSIHEPRPMYYENRLDEKNKQIFIQNPSSHVYVASIRIRSYGAADRPFRRLRMLTSNLVPIRIYCGSSQKPRVQDQCIGFLFYRAGLGTRSRPSAVGPGSRRRSTPTTTTGSAGRTRPGTTPSTSTSASSRRT